MAAAGRNRPKNNGLRIALIVEAVDTGLGQLIYLLARGLDQRGHEVHLLHSIQRAEPEILERLRALPGVRCAAVDMRRGIHATDLHAVANIRRYLSQHGPFDVVHGHSSKGGALARLCGVGLCATRIYTPHAYYTLSPALSPLQRFVYGTIEWGLSFFCSATICSSEMEKRHAELLGIASKRMAVIGNAIEPPKLLPPARGKLQLPDQAFVVGFVGRLEYQKAPDLLLHAIAAAIRQNRNIKLVMVGSGALETELRDMARGLGIEDHVHWLGRQPSQHWLASFDMLALPSRYEGFSLMPLEAMYASLPVVCTPVGGIAEAVIDGVTGIVVKTDDAAGFAQAILKLADDPDLRAGMASAARARAGLFTPETMVAGIEQVYGLALDASRKDLPAPLRPAGQEHGR